jgi:poly(A) polymerase
VRFIGDPDRRIAEDRLRVLRFFRFHAWFGRPPLDAAGFDACRRNAAGLRSLSAERVTKELLRLLSAPAPVDALEAMVEAGALDHWLPEFAGTARLRALIEREDAPDSLRRLAAIVAPDTRGTHVILAAFEIGKRLKLSSADQVRLAAMLNPEPPVDIAGGPVAWRIGVFRQGNKIYADRVLLDLDAPGDWCGALELARHWTAPRLPINGNDALALGVKPSPDVGQLLDLVAAWWIKGDFAADREACLAELERLVRARQA